MSLPAASVNNGAEPPSPGAAAWADALEALRLFAADPVGLGGIAVRAGHGPVRARFLALLRQALPPATPARTIPPHIGDDRLLGGLDLPATLAAGRPVAQSGVLAEANGGVIILTMAERTETLVAVQLRAALDTGSVALQRDGLSAVIPARFGLVVLDEGCDPDERPPAALLDRLAFHLDLTPVSLRDAARDVSRAAAPEPPDAQLQRNAAAASYPRRNAITSSVMAGPCPRPCAGDLPAIRDFPGETKDVDSPDAPGYRSMEMVGGPHGAAPSQTSGADQSSSPLAPDPIACLVQTAAALGIDSPRAPLLALRAARSLASMAGRPDISDADLMLAARLVLAPRAIHLPSPPDAAPPEPQPETDPPQTDDAPETLPEQALADVILASVAAALPPDLLERLSHDPSRSAGRTPGRAGQMRISLKRGRPVGTRPGAPGNGARLHLLETLKAAAPWQTLRGCGDRFQVRRDDLRIIRFRQKLGTATVFAVDASGSAALHRLAEAKGAVELLLADCYVRRDQVALIAFRGHEATLLLPPTGSLLRAKRSLAALPGGGATPLAAGIDAAMRLTETIRRGGRTPVVAMLTDARANIGRDGSPGRTQAEADALAAAKTLGSTGIASLLVDTSPRPNPFARRLAEAMRARYVPLPHADAGTLSRAVRDVAA